MWMSACVSVWAVEIAVLVACVYLCVCVCASALHQGQLWPLPPGAARCLKGLTWSQPQLVLV
jgi:hypothetical protein